MSPLLSLKILQSLIPFLFPWQQDTIKMVFIGDIMQHGPQIRASLKPKIDDNSNSYDYSSYFKHLEKTFKEADIVAANMETTFAPPPYSGYPCFSAPSSLAEECRNSGINLLMAANNHTCDKGIAGIKGSISLFDSLKIRHIGIYRDSGDESKRYPLLLNVKGYNIAFLNYTYGTNGLPVPKPYIVKQLDSNKIKMDMVRARLLYPDYTVVCVHWGYEYHLKHSKEQEMWEKLFYKNGADVIIGSHPHVPQDLNIIQDSCGNIKHITVYSLGNAVSNMSDENTRIGMLFRLNLIKKTATRDRFIEYSYEYIWSAHPREVEKNYSILPMKEFISMPEKFSHPDYYGIMKKYHLKFK